MSCFEELLRSVEHTSPIQSGWQVEIYDASNSDHKDILKNYLELGKVKSVCDTIHDQLLDYLRSRNPRSKASNSDLLNDFLSELGEDSLNNFGVWVYYPWSGQLVHTLPKDAFQTLRTDRNRHKISEAEQERLSRATIGIVGLSAGMAIARTMALEGVGGRFRLADFDTLGLSNLNRIQASISELGLCKTVVAARSMLELNPFLDIQIYSSGINEENIHGFFQDDGDLDILVEECDSLWMKVRLREEAKRRAVPVIMDTSDRGLLDVERFDLEKDRPLFHGLIGNTQAEAIKLLSPEERIGFVLTILEAEQLSPNASASLLEIGHTVSTWPQLGSAVVAGGAVVTDVVRRLLLKSFTESGRFSVDVEAIVANGKGNRDCVPVPETPAIEGMFPSLPTKLPLKVSGTLTDEEFQWLVSHASLAPSGGNSQPWRFKREENSILGFLAPERRSPILDHNYTASLLALGAAAENIMLSASELQLAAEMQVLKGDPTTNAVFRIRLSRTDDSCDRSELFEYISSRCTNRKLSSRVLLQPHQIQSLSEEANRSKASLILHTESTDLDGISKIIGYGDRLRFLSESLHREMMDELRWTQHEVTARKDGIDIATLELSKANAAVLRLLSSWQTMLRLREIGGGAGLETPSQLAIEAASGFALLRHRTDVFSSHFDGGRALQRLWLRATSLGLSIQPMSVLVYLFDRIENGDTSCLDSETRNGLQDLLGRYRTWFPKEQGSTDLLLFRIAVAEPPSVRSNRLILEDILVRSTQ